MRTQHARLDASRLALALLLLIPLASRAAHGAGAAPLDPTRDRAAHPHVIPVSAAGAELMREVWEAGGLRNNPHVRAVVERFQREDLSPYLEEAAEPPVAVRRYPALVQALGNDAIVNDRSLSTCTCGGRPISEAEPSVAAWGPYVVASWNDRRNNCIVGTGLPTQSHAYSRDYGATFREGALLRGPGPTDVFHGDPTVAANRKAGNFYISGILRQGGTFVGVTALRGHFGPDSFVIDLRKVIGLASGGDFYDKPWMAVDSLTGRVYITWTNFKGDGATQIELQRLDADLNPLAPVQVVRAEPLGLSGVQGSYPTVGPEGELYVPYSLLSGDYDLLPPAESSQFEIVRSDDGGATFGPPHVIAIGSYYSSLPQPGSQRGFWVPLLAVDVDRSRGPHRGRVYATWAESRPADGAVFTSGAVVEKENNRFFASATSFTPGATLRGFSNGVDNDMFKFTGLRGQVFWCDGDSVPGSLRVRLICSGDTSALANYHLLHTRNPTIGGSDIFAAGLPYDGTYYLQIESPFANFLPYRFITALVPYPPGLRARDVRDQFMAWSDGGTSWSAPVRLNDDDPWFDGAMPQVAVDGRGRVHAFWFDWRDDPQCGTSSNQYAASSGDGGVTWGVNRRLTDASSFWGTLASCSDNNQGDFMQMAADGDHVYAVFPDSRLGDPDVFLDASVYRSSAACPPNQVIASGIDAVLSFALANDGNFATSLAWRLTDTRGWLTGATPATAGSASLAAGGGSIAIAGTFHPPLGCGGDSSIVRFVTYDPAIPGLEDTCLTVLHCDTGVPTLLALVEQRVRGDRVTLRWYAADAAGAIATIERRAGGGEWIARGTLTADAAGIFTFEDRDVTPGRYDYRIGLADGAGGVMRNELSVEVPALALTLRGTSPNPAGDGRFIVSFTLPASTPATLDLLDLAGRRLASRAVGELGPGPHELRLAEADALPGGVYVMRLRQDGREVTRKTVIVR